MIRLPLKYIFLTLFVLINLFGINKSIPTIQLLKLYIIVGLIPLIVIFVARFNLINLLIIFFFSVLFKDMGQLPLPLLPDIFPWRLVWIVMIMVLIYELVSKKNARLLPITDIEVAMVLFSFMIFLSMLSAGTFYEKGKGLTLNYYLNGYGIPFSIFFFSKNIVVSDDNIRKLFTFFSIVGLYLGLTGIFEYFDIEQLVFPSKIMIPWEGVTWGRARGPFMNSAVNGTAIGMIIFILLYQLLHEKIFWRKTLYILTLASLLSTLVFTLTRGCWIAFIAALLVSSLFIPTVRKVLIPGVVGLSTVIIIIVITSNIQFRTGFTERDLHSDTEATLIDKIVYRTQKWKTIKGRIDLYKISLQMFLEKPLFGYGYGAFVTAKEDYIMKTEREVGAEGFIQKKARSHDTLAGLIVDMGLIGSSFLFYIIFKIVMAFRSVYRRNKQFGTVFGKEELPVLCFSIFVVYLINIQTIDVRNFLFPNCLFFLIAGIIVGINQRQSLKRSMRHVDADAHSVAA